MEDDGSNSSFMNLVWFQEELCQWNTIVNSNSIAQYKESKVLPVIQFIQNQFHTNYEFCESMKMHGYAKLHTDLNMSDLIGRSLYHKQSMNNTGLPFVYKK